MTKSKQDFTFYKERKGQSAIEYLMTYGWMLLVVAIVGGAIFATVQGQCQSAANGFGDSVEVDDFGVSDGDNLQVELRNVDNDPLFVTGGELAQDDGQLDVETESVYRQDDDGDFHEIDSDDELRIDVTDTEVVYLGVDEVDENVVSSEGCNDLGFTVDYNVGSLTGQSESGTLTDEHEISEEA